MEGYNIEKEMREAIEAGENALYSLRAAKEGNQIRENFGLEHTPIRLVVRERGSGEVGAKDV